MCICFFTTEHPSYSLVLATNRDEFLSRPTLAAEWWSPDGTGTGAESAETPQRPVSILSGLDVSGGGTWFGIESSSGRFGLLTNVREEEASVRSRSRGRLVTDWLQEPTADTVAGHLEHLGSTMQEYAAFNLLLGRISGDGQVELGYLSNRTEALSTCTKDLQDGSESSGYGVMSNGALACGNDATHLSSTLRSAWPKMGTGRSAFRRAIDRDAACPGPQAALIESLLGVLDINPLAILDKEHVRSSVLVTPFDMFPPKAAWYATRAQSVLLVRRSSSPEVTFVERQAYTLDAQQAAAAPVWSDRRREWTFTVSE